MNFPTAGRVRLASVFVSLMLVAAPRLAQAEWLYALTSDNHLELFVPGNPAASIDRVAITGLPAGAVLYAIDFRPLDGQIYGLAAAGPAPSADWRLYRINPISGAATAISTAPLEIVPGGTEIGFDFNALTGHIRIVTSTGQNFRVDASTGAAVDGNPGVDGVQPDTPLNAPGPVLAIGHSNNFTGTAASSLYGIDAGADTLVRIGGLGGTPSPNLGAVNTIGALGVDVDGWAGLDLALPINQLHAALRLTDGTVKLAKINLATGAATITGTLVTTGAAPVRDIAVLSRPVTAYALTADHVLVRFKTHLIGGITSVPVTGLMEQGGGERLVAIDTRPATGELYGVSNRGRVYKIDTATGAAQRQGSNTGTTLTGVDFGMDFDPIADRLRLISGAGMNKVIDPREATATSAGDLSQLGIVALAYARDNPRAATPSATAYAISASQDSLFAFGGPGGTPSPDSGLLLPIGGLQVNVSVNTGFDIDDGSHVGYMTTFTGTADVLYVTDLSTGVSTLVGTVAHPNGPIVSMTLSQPPLIHFNGGLHEVAESAPAVNTYAQRVPGTEGPFTLDYASIGGTATPGADYTPVKGTLIFLEGDTQKNFSVPLMDDAVMEDLVEFVNVQVSAPTVGARVRGSVNMEIAIVDSESPPNTPPAIAIETPTREPAFEAHSRLITLSGTASDDRGVVEVRWRDDRGNSGVAQGTTHWLIPDYVLTGGGPITITVTAVDQPRAQFSADLAITLTPPFTSLLAEGATGQFFDLNILLANPHSQSVDATLTFLKENGTTVTHTRTLAALSRTTVRVDEIAGMESTSASTVITSPVPIVVERTMMWDGVTGYGAHTEKAVDGAALKWYFAEGAQGFFFTYLLLANPGATANTATVEYLREGAAPVTRTYELAPSSRRTVDAGADRELVDRAFGMTVTFARPGVAERAMYFGLDPLWKAGHESAGVTVPSTSWFLAEGATGPFFETFILIANPQGAPAEITATYLLQGAPPVTRTHTVPASGRLTINLEQEDAALANAAAGTRIVSSLPVVVERAQYWPFAPSQWHEAHNSFGVIATAQEWALAEGRAGDPSSSGRDDYETYILLANPGSTAANVTMTFLRTSGAPIVKTFTVPAESRLNVATGANGPIPELSNEEFSTVIVSNQPIAVERAMYVTSGGVTWTAGTNATATRVVRP